MNERPLICAAWEVQAILDRRKTQARRVVDRVAGRGRVTEFGKSETPGYDWTFRDRCMRWHDLRGKELMARCPFGVAGDRLWVKETWAQIWNQEYCRNPEGVCPCGGCHFEYKADTGAKYPGGWDSDAAGDPECPKWRSSACMPRRASRLLLERLTNRPPERLYNISVDDCVAEGIDLDGEYEETHVDLLEILRCDLPVVDHGRRLVGE